MIMRKVAAIEHPTSHGTVGSVEVEICHVLRKRRMVLMPLPLPMPMWLDGQARQELKLENGYPSTGFNNSSLFARLALCVLKLPSLSQRPRLCDLKEKVHRALLPDQSPALLPAVRNELSEGHGEAFPLPASRVQ